MIRLTNTILVILIAFLSFSCDAPRLNPLDPQSPSYSKGQLDGYVFSYPRDPLHGVRVTLKGQNLSVLTDTKGYYKIENAEMQNGIVYIEKEGFKKDSISIVWNGQKNLRLEERRLDYTVGKIEGTIRAAAPSLTLLNNVKVTWKNKSVFTHTDQFGKFYFDNTSYENGWLYFELDNYSVDSFYVDFNNQRESTKNVGNLYLNSIPKLHDFKIYTSVENRPPNIKNYRIEIQADISDDEGDIDSVFLKCDELKISRAINYNLSTRHFEGRFKIIELNLVSMEDVIGKDFYIVVRDRHNKTFSVGSSNVKRVINDYVQILSPANEEFTNSLPAFYWDRFQPGFNFEYSVEVFTRETIPVLVWSRENIKKEDTQTLMTSTPSFTGLPSGDYYWVIWCVDDFGNRAQSTPGTFSVK